MVILVEKKGDGVALVTLNRPEAMNALSRELRRGILDAFAGLSRDTDVRAIVLTGAGRAFCAGLDLKELSGDASVLQARTQDAAIGSLVQVMAKCPAPIIGAINGAAITGGFELALACDILVGSENARFADTHARVGIMPDWGLSQKLSRLIGISRAKEISLSGNFIDAQTAVAWGLINRVTPAAELVESALKLARDIASSPPAMTQAYKRLISDGYALTFGEAMTLEHERAQAHNAAVNASDVGKAKDDVFARGRAQTKG